MLFSKLGLSVARSSRSRGLLYGGVVRSPILSDGRFRSPMGVESAVDRLDGLGFLRLHITPLAAQKCQIPKDLSGVLATPGIHRFFSFKVPNNENHHLRGEDQTPEHERESESQGDSETDDDRDTREAQLRDLLFDVLHSASVLLLCFLRGAEISFEDFENDLLKRGVVDRIIVSNGSVARVYLRNVDQEDPGNGSPTKRRDALLYYIRIGSIESFGQKLEEALSIDPRNYVPVTYKSELFCPQEFLTDACLVFCLVAGTYFWRRVRKPHG